MATGKTILRQDMPKKQKNRMIKRAFTVSIFIMIFQVPGYAAAVDPAFSEALYANPPPVWMSEQAAASDSPSPDLSGSNTAETEEISKAPLQENKLNLPSDALNQIEWAPAKNISLQSFIDRVDLYNRTGTTQSLLVLGWDRHAGSPNKWNVVFGIGIYISNYHDRNHPAEYFDLEEPVSDRDQMDLIEKLKNALQVVGFQIRYDF
jgi:hypothetical protein